MARGLRGWRKKSELEVREWSLRGNRQRPLPAMAGEDVCVEDDAESDGQKETGVEGGRRGMNGDGYGK